MATHIVTGTLRQILGTRRLLLFGALALVAPALFYLNSPDQSSFGLLENFVGFATGLHFLLALPITALILSAAVLGTERRDQTLSFVVVRPIPRTSIVAAKLGAAFIAAAMITTVGALAMGVVYGLVADDWGYVVPIVVGSLLATAAYTAFFVPLGYLTERSTLIGLAYVFVWENGILAAIGALGITSPWRIGYSAFVDLAPPEMLLFVEDFALSDLSASVGPAVIRVAALVAISAAFLTWVLRTRDLV